LTPDWIGSLQRVEPPADDSQAFIDNCGECHAERDETSGDSDRLIGSHLTILQLFQNPKTWRSRERANGFQIGRPATRKILEGALPHWRGRSDSHNSVAALSCFETTSFLSFLSPTPPLERCAGDIERGGGLRESQGRDGGEAMGWHGTLGSPETFPLRPGSLETRNDPFSDAVTFEFGEWTGKGVHAL
jgi:hypothetical protein